MSKGRRVPPKFDVSTIDLPITNQVTKQDRQYFDEHPDASEYTRPYVQGEAPHLQQTIDHVIVTKIRTDIRQRTFIEPGEVGRLLCVDYDGTDQATINRVHQFYRQELQRMGVR